MSMSIVQHLLRKELVEQCRSTMSRGAGFRDQFVLRTPSSENSLQKQNNIIIYYVYLYVYIYIDSLVHAGSSVLAVFLSHVTTSAALNLEIV